MSAYKSKLASLRADVQKTVKRWGRHDVYPTLGDIANSVRKWKTTIDSLGVHDDVRSSTYNEAEENATLAFENRDDRQKALRHINRMLKAVEQLEEELETPESVATVSRVNAKAMFGAVLNHQGVDDRVIEKLYPIKRTIDGLVADRVRDITYRSRIKSVQEQIYEIGAYYGEVPMMRPTLSRIKSLIDRAVRISAAPVKSNDENRLLATLSSEIDTLAIQFNGYYGVSELPEMTEANSYRVKAYISEIDDLITRQPFETPQKLTMEIGRRIKAVQTELRRFNDTTTVRTAQKVLDHLSGAYNASSAPAVKSLSLSGWQVPDVQNNYENAMDEYANLRSELGISQ